jgi:signal transduction histidine kinase
MKIKNKLRLNVILSLLAAGVICLMFVVSLYRLDRANHSAKIADEIVAIMLERVTLRSDYLRNTSVRAREQWLSKHAQILKLLKTELEIQRNAEDIRTINAFIADNETTGKIFADIVANRERNGVPPSSAEHKPNSVDLAREAEERLLSQLNIRVYEEAFHSRRLLESSRRASVAALRLAGSSLVVSLFILVAMAMANSWTMGRAITERVRSLRDGAAVIGAGDLSHRIDIKGDDEFAEISQAFDAMAAKLSVSYHDLKIEVIERRRADEALQERTAQLEAANKELESFSYSVSHDLRAPLRAINGFSAILQEDYKSVLDADGQRYLDLVRQGAERMGRLIDDILAFSRMSRGEIGMETVDLAEMTEEIFAELSAAAPGRVIRLVLGDLPSARCDRAMIRQALRNLLSNAVKYTGPRPEAVIEVFGTAGDAENAYCVKDNGVGFDMGKGDKLFGAFQRFHSAGEFEGTGIGLAILKRIVERHGGRVWAEAKVGEGAAFHFTLPAMQPKA